VEGHRPHTGRLLQRVFLFLLPEISISGKRGPKELEYEDLFSGLESSHIWPFLFLLHTPAPAGHFFRKKYDRSGTDI